MRASVLVAAFLLAGCAGTPTETTTQQPLPTSSTHEGPASSSTSASAPPAMVPAAPQGAREVEVFRTVAGGRVDASANLPAMVNGGTNTLSSHTRLDAMPPSGLHRIEVLFSWEAQVSVGQGAVWLWETDSDPLTSLDAYEFRLASDAGTIRSHNLTGAAWDALREPWFTVGAYGGDGLAMARDLSYRIEVVGWALTTQSMGP